MISFPQIKFSSQLINRINVRCNEYRVQSTEKYQRLDSAPFPFPLHKDQNPRVYFSKSDRNSNSLGMEKKSKNLAGFSRSQWRQIYLVSGISRFRPASNGIVLIGRQRKHATLPCYVSLFHLIPRHVSLVYSISSGTAAKGALFSWKIESSPGRINLPITMEQPPNFARYRV